MSTEISRATGMSLTTSTAFLQSVRRDTPLIRRAAGATDLEPALLTASERLQYFQRRQATNQVVR